MEIRATIKLRNNKMVQARKKLGLSQMGLSLLTGVHIASIGSLELLRFPGKLSEDKIEYLCDALDLDRDDVYPESLRGESIPNSFSAVREVPTQAILSSFQNNSFLLPSPARQAEDGDSLDKIKTILSQLTDIDQEVVEMCFGLNGKIPMSKKEIARKLKITIQAASMRVNTAIKHIQEKLRWEETKFASLRDQPFIDEWVNEVAGK